MHQLVFHKIAMKLASRIDTDTFAAGACVRAGPAAAAATGRILAKMMIPEKSCLYFGD